MTPNEMTFEEITLRVNYCTTSMFGLVWKDRHGKEVGYVVWKTACRRKLEYDVLAMKATSVDVAKEMMGYLSADKVRVNSQTKKVWDVLGTLV